MSERSCKHKWVDMEDGTRDKFCVRCSHKAKQAVITINDNPAPSFGMRNINDDELQKCLEKQLLKISIRQAFGR